MIEERLSQATIRGAGTLGLRVAPDPLPAGFGITHRWEPYTAEVEPGDTLGTSPTLSVLRDLAGTADLVPNAVGSTGATGATYQMVAGQAALGFGAPRRLMTALSRSQPHTVVALVRPRNEPYTELSAVIGASTGAGLRGSVFAATDGTWAMNAGNTVGGLPVKGGQWQVLTAVFNGASSTLRVDGVEISGNAGTDIADRLILGSLALLGGPFVGYISSVYYAPVAWSAAQRLTFEAWVRATNRLPL